MKYTIRNNCLIFKELYIAMACKRLLTSMQSLSMERQAILYLALYSTWNNLYGKSMLFETFPPFLQDLEMLKEKVYVGLNYSEVIRNEVEFLDKDLKQLFSLGEGNKSHKDISAAYSRLKCAIKEIIRYLKAESEDDIEKIIGTVLFKRTETILPKIEYIGVITSSTIMSAESEKLCRETDKLLAKYR